MTAQLTDRNETDVQKSDRLNRELISALLVANDHTFCCDSLIKIRAKRVILTARKLKDSFSAAHCISAATSQIEHYHAAVLARAQGLAYGPARIVRQHVI